MTPQISLVFFFSFFPEVPEQSKITFDLEQE